MIRCSRLLLSVLVAAGVSGCREQAEPAPAVAPHGDHKPHHGGLVMMRGDLHYEVVFDATGRAYQVFFSDAVRRTLPPSTASVVTLTLTRPDNSEERIALHIDPARQAWVGGGRPVLDPERTTARLAFTIDSGAYWIDLPFSSPVSAGGRAGK